MLQSFRNDIRIFMRDSNSKEWWTGQKYTCIIMCIEARAHFLKHPQYLILEPGLDKTSCVWAVWAAAHIQAIAWSFMCQYVLEKLAGYSLISSVKLSIQLE